MHFMVVDQDGDPVEILTKLAVVGSEIGWGEGSGLDGELQGAFGAARPEWGREGEEVWGHTAKWYEGDSSLSDFKKKVEKATVKGETWVWARVRTGDIKFYKDSVNDPVYTVHKAIYGTYFTISAEAGRAAATGYCNMDESFGMPSATGFTGWFTDPELTEAAPERWMVEEREYHLFARNRLSTRYAYADGSALPEPGAVYRRAPRETAGAVPAAMGLPDFSGDERQHMLGKPAEASGFGGERARAARAREALGEVELPPTGDCGPAHETLYLGEHVSLGTPARVYREMGDGRWRSYRCLGWFRDPAATLSALGSTTPDRDCAYYVKWEESTVDGVVARGGVGE